MNASDGLYKNNTSDVSSWSSMKIATIAKEKYT